MSEDLIWNSAVTYAKQRPDIPAVLSDPQDPQDPQDKVFQKTCKNLILEIGKLNKVSQSREADEPITATIFPIGSKSLAACRTEK